jgi:acetamidase/formamidase
MKMAVRQSINFISLRYRIQKQTALAYLSAATTFEVSQVVDKTKGVHSLIKKSDFEK